MKPCSRCGVEKPLTEFYRQARAPDGHAYECKACASEAQRAWRKANPIARRKWDKAHPEKHRAYAAKYAKANRDKGRARTQKHRTANRIACNARERELYAANAAKRIAKSRAWNVAHPEKVSAREAARRAAQIHATPAWANEFFIREAYALARLRTKLRTGGVSKWHVDHVVPLRSKLVCGLHVENNLEVIPAVLNVAKNNRYWPDMPT